MCRAELTGEIGIVITDRLSLRRRPTVNSQRLAVLPRGTTVKILAHTGDWVKVIHGGHTGYLRNLERYLRLSRPRPLPPPGIEDTETLEEANRRVMAEIEASRSAVDAMTRKETEILEILDGIDITLNGIRKKIAEYRRDIHRLENRLSRARDRYRRVARQAESNRRAMKKRLVSLYKLGWLGRLNVLASADSFYDLVKRRDAMERILARDRELLSRLAVQKKELADLTRRIAEQKQEKIALTAARKKALRRAAREKARRAAILAEIRTRKTLELAAMDMLRQAAADLDRTIRDIAARPRPPAAASGPGDNRPFSELKGLLPMPVKGKIVTRFGKYTDTRYNVVNFRSGIDIQADRGEPIHAVHAGRVIFADWFKGYGNMMIIDHEDSYYSVYAHAEELFKKKGDRVEAGEVIATVGESGSLIGPGLYFEVRHHGRPMDPLRWIQIG